MTDGNEHIIYMNDDDFDEPIPIPTPEPTPEHDWNEEDQKKYNAERGI